MSRDLRQYLNDILEAVARIEQYTAGVNLDAFKADAMRIDAVSMNLMIIGEAARNLPDAVKQRYPDTDWRNIVGLRNIITHEYFRLNLDRIWNVVEVELPILRQQITAILERERDNGEK